MAKKGHYIRIPNYHIWDKDLSWKAKGMLTTLLAMPKTWDFSIKGLATLSNDSDSTIRSCLKELEQKGYLRRYSVREKGKIIKWVYEFDGSILPVVEKPHVEKQQVEKSHVDNPLVEKSLVEKPLVENQTQLNIKSSNINKELNIKEIKEKKENLISSSKCTEFDVIIDTFEDEKIQEALREFIKMRFTSKKGLTTASFQMLTDQLKKMTSSESEQLQIINASLMNGWNVFYPLDKNPNSLKVIKPTNDDDVQIEHEDVSDEELLELQRSLRGDD